MIDDKAHHITRYIKGTCHIMRGFDKELRICHDLLQHSEDVN